MKLWAAACLLGAVAACGPTSGADTNEASDDARAGEAGEVGSGGSAAGGSSGSAGLPTGGTGTPTGGAAGRAGEPSTGGTGGSVASGGAGGLSGQAGGAGELVGGAGMAGVGGAGAGAGGSSAGAGAGSGGAVAAGSGGSGGQPTRALLGCGKATSGYPCGADRYLWECPDEAQPIGPFTSPVGNHASVGCEATTRANQWCCVAQCVLDTRLDPSETCPPQQRPFQCNHSPDGMYSCTGTI